MQNASIYEPLAIILIIVMLFLLLVIGLLANVLLGTASWYRQKDKEEEKNAAVSAGKAAVVTTLAGLLLSVLPAQAQEKTGLVEQVTQIGGLSPTVFYFMTGVIAVELLVIFVMLLQLRFLIIKRKERAQPVSRPAKIKKIWSKLNKFKPVEEEAALDLGHEYDGIRELNNRLPPWWLYGFYLTIIFGVIYLWRYHVTETAPLSGEEYEIAMRHAEEQKAAIPQKIRQ